LLQQKMREVTSSGRLARYPNERTVHPLRLVIVDNGGTIKGVRQYALKKGLAILD